MTKGISKAEEEAQPDFLTVPELASLLRLKERKIYALAAEGKVPCNRATGKLLFPRNAIEAWLAQYHHQPSAEPNKVVPAVIAGSHDPLLDWALRESGCGIASYFDGSTDGLSRMVSGEAMAAGLHLYDADSDNWNRSQVELRLQDRPVVMLEWAWRERGLLVAEDNPLMLSGLADLVGRRFIERQAGAGSQVLFDILIAREGLDAGDIEKIVPPARSEHDLALAIAEGKADAGFGLACAARPLKLAFLPLIKERFDLVVDRRAYFTEHFQLFLRFCQTSIFAEKAEALGGYELRATGHVNYLP